MLFVLTEMPVPPLFEAELALTWPPCPVTIPEEELLNAVQPATSELLSTVIPALALNEAVHEITLLPMPALIPFNVLARAIQSLIVLSRSALMPMPSFE
jgi:hypothetical protein